MKHVSGQAMSLSNFDIENAVIVQSAGQGAPAIIVFSSVNSNGFSFFKTFDKSPMTKIFIRDPFDSWYQNGVSSELSNPHRLSDYIIEIFRTLRPARTISVGSSMGGYAALLFGILIRANAIVAMSPQTIIDSRLPHTPSMDFSKKKYYDLGDLIKTKNRHRPDIHLLYGADDIVDIWNATRVATMKSDSRIPIAGRDHLASMLVVANGDLSRIVESSIHGRSPELLSILDQRCQVERVHRIIDRLIRAIFFKETGLDEYAWAKRFSRLYPEWSVPHDALRMIAEQRGDIAAAEIAADRAAALSPTSVTLQTNHASILMRLGHEKKALAAFERCLKIRPKHYAALCALAILEARSGDISQAEARLEMAVNIRPRLQRAHLIRATIRSGQTPKLPGANDKPEDM